MDGFPPAGVPDQSRTEADECMAVFKAKLVAVEEAAREWGLRWQEPEGRFVSALLGAIAMLGDLSRAAQGSIEAMARQHREAAALELAGAKEITRAAEVSLRQARQAQIALVVEKENLTLRMIKETLPLFVERLKEALIIREKRWNDDIKRRRLATAGLVTLGLVLGGYGLHMWQSWDATNALEWCLWHQLQGNGHIYCNLTGFRQSHP
jgi:uncharacterized membrane protein YbjE (DUF340 family)